MDVSADLVELGRTPVTVVCAGAKSILDIPRTLEYLETQVTSPASSIIRHLLNSSGAGVEMVARWAEPTPLCITVAASAAEKWPCAMSKD